MRNGTVAWTRKILSAEPIQFLIQKPDTIGGKFAKTKNRRAHAFNCEEYHILVSGSESPQNPRPQQRWPWPSANVICWEIHINRIDCSYSHGTFNKSPSPVAIPWGELWLAPPTSNSVTALPILPRLTIPCSNEHIAAVTWRKGVNHSSAGNGLRWGRSQNQSSPDLLRETGLLGKLPYKWI